MWAISNPHYVTLSRNKLPDEDPDSGIESFPLPDSGTAQRDGTYAKLTPWGHHWPHPVSPTGPCAASSMRAQTLEREVPSSADSQGSADNAIVHSTSESPSWLPEGCDLFRISSPNQPPQVQCPYLSDEIVFSSKSCTCWQKWKTGSRKDSH